MNHCTVCGNEATNGDRYTTYPYCADCHWSGAAYTHIWRDTVAAVTEAGFPATVWQTGGGCMNLAVALTEGGFGGAVALMGLLGDTVADSEIGCCILAHGDTEPEECYAYERECEPCAVLARIADTASVAVRDDFTADDYRAWVIATAKELAKAIAAHPHHA